MQIFEGYLITLAALLVGGAFIAPFVILARKGFGKVVIPILFALAEAGFLAMFIAGAIKQDLALYIISVIFILIISALMTTYLKRWRHE